MKERRRRIFFRASVRQVNEFEAGNRRGNVECCQCERRVGWMSVRRDGGS